ncbi:hypothetical protein VNO77_40485 [Canavalia gladiata]|uniref:DNA mismatch repair protein S5 domain-containing protein n=1 Tax=Canavalia gladiata TaxID=3824 RepID=A0AAN9PR54_CANGL
MASIRHLPEAVRSSVRSGIFLFDFARVVEELIFNSLDARATKVSVFVSVGSCYLKVVDDGCGITRDGLELVGERYAATSKFLNLADLNAKSEHFGFRGEALASISEVSLLEIVTRTSGRPNGYQKVLKGCKCLYLGIDDHRKEVGTAVVVRDLFYNQPVRRKYMQSSPNKVLQSIKKCVMRLSLVRPNISFRIVDIEREDELFCTHSASSPLSLVTSGFGMELSSSLLNLEVENDVIKLSGYISSPCNTLNMKVLQYVYINSQFVCKGPIHKVLNQLSTAFEHRNSWNTDNEFQNKKRTKSQACPAYILNLSCPRSLYDLSFEPSKTCVKFKDWTPILNFIEKAIKQFWEDNIACAKFSNKATYISQGDQPKKANVNVISGVSDISEFRNQNRKDCLDLFSNSDKLIDDHHQSNMEDVRTSLGYLHQETAMFKEQKSKGDFLCQTGYSGNLLDVSYAKCMSTVMRKYTSLLMYDNNDLLQENYFFDGKISAAEKFYCNVPFDAPSSSHRRKFHEVDADVISESFEDDLLYDCNRFSSDVSISRELQKPFLKRCSTQEGSILHEKALFVNDEHKLQTDSFWSKQNLGEDYGSDKDLYSLSCPEVAKKLKMSEDSDFLVRTFAAENSLTAVSCYSATQIGCSGSDDQLLNSEWHPVCQEPSSQATALGVYHTTDIKDDLRGRSRYKRIHHTELFDDRDNECNFNYSISRNANQHHCTTSFTNIGFNFDDAGDCVEMFDRLVDWPNFGDMYSTKRSDILDKELDWLLPESHVINCKRPSKNKGKRDHFRNSTSEENHERSRRSFSAPPFHRSKRRFFSLNHPSEMIAKRWTGQASNPAFNHQEATDFKYPQQSPTALYPSTDDLFMQEFKTNVEQSSEVLGDTHINDITKIDRFESFNIQNSAPFRGPNGGTAHLKLQLCCQYLEANYVTYKIFVGIVNGLFDLTISMTFVQNILANVQSQNNILDISSGLLHLAGDSLIPETISRKCLEDAKVLHQVDKKFIPIVAGRTLAVIDQIYMQLHPYTWKKNPCSYGYIYLPHHPAISLSAFCSGSAKEGRSVMAWWSTRKIQLKLSPLACVTSAYYKSTCSHGSKHTAQNCSLNSSFHDPFKLHAADERIRLEEFRQKVLSGEAKAITYLDAEQELVLPEIGYQLLHSYSEQIKDWGWICNIHAKKSESFRRNLDILNRPQMAVILIAVNTVLFSPFNFLADTNGSSAMPPSVIRVLNLKACRGAIMFGDSLLPSECSLLVEELKHTSLCFQCAHGRPTTVPLVNLEALHNQIANLGLMNKRSNGEWHRLHRHKICVERAAQRLCSARGS